MDFYDQVNAGISRSITMQYSTSFSTATRLFDARIRPHIYAIYGWVRVADEIVDTYRGPDASDLLRRYKQDTAKAINAGFSTNPVIHSFAHTARTYGISESLINRFIASMEIDLKPPKQFTKKTLHAYIDGSAVVVGLMCLKVITEGNKAEFEHLRFGAESLAAAFQKINFLRDFAYDTKVLGRSYFPNVKHGRLSESTKDRIIRDIRHDFTHSLPALVQLPKSARLAVTVAARYHYALLDKLAETPASIINEKRIRIPDWRKAQILASATAGHSLKRTAF